MRLMFIEDSVIEYLRDKEESENRWDTMSPEELISKLEDMIESGEISNEDSLLLIKDLKN